MVERYGFTRCKEQPKENYVDQEGTVKKLWQKYSQIKEMLSQYSIEEDINGGRLGIV